MKNWIVGAAAAACVLAAADGRTHYGRLDGHGCHYNPQAPGYHCHTGKLAGRQFKSKEDALKRPKATEPKQKKSVSATKVS